MDTRKLLLSHSMFLLMAAGFATLKPSFVQPTSMRVIHKGLSIQTSKFEPPRVAFDEVFGDVNLNEWALLKSKTGSQNLNEATQTFVAKNPVQALSAKKIVLQPMSFSKTEFDKHQEEQAWIDALPNKEQKRLIAAQEKNRVLDQDWNLPSFRELAEEKVREAKLAETQETESNILIEATDANGETRNIQSVRTADVQVKKDTDADSKPSQFQVSGEIELAGGLPAGPQWVIQVARYEDDIKKEDARFDHAKGMYRIQVPELAGSIYAQLVDQTSGEILGEGSYRLSAYSKEQHNGRAKITIQRANNAIASRFQSFYGNPNRLSTERAVGSPNQAVKTRVLFASADVEDQTDETGVYRFEQIMKGSWGLLRTEAKDYYPSLFLVKSGQEKQYPLFPEKMVKALKQIIADQTMTSSVPETGSIVWGQVLQDGKPVAGVSISAEISDLYQPIYFNSLLIPDSSLKSTSENGFFAFIHLPSGFQSLMASRGSGYLSHANVVVDEGAISIAEMETSLQTEKVEVKVFDAFTGNPQIAQLEIQSLAEQLNVQGYAEIDLPKISRMSLMQVHPASEEYLITQQPYEDQTDYLHVPLISKTWLYQLRNERRVNINPNAGLIVGFVSSGEFEVYLGHDSDFSRDNVIYFNPQGQIESSGVAGGGFILVNVPTGVQSVVVASKSSQVIQTQVIPVDLHATSVAKFR